MVSLAPLGDATFLRMIVAAEQAAITAAKTRIFQSITIQFVGSVINITVRRDRAGRPIRRTRPPLRVSRCARLCRLNHDLSPAPIGAIERPKGLFRFARVGHLHEAEAARAPGFVVDNHLRAINKPVLAECLFQSFRGH